MGANLQNIGHTAQTELPQGTVEFVIGHRWELLVTVTDPTLLPRVVNKLANDIVALLAAKGARVDIAIDVSAELATGIDQPLAERLLANSSAHEFPPPEFD